MRIITKIIAVLAICFFLVTVGVSIYVFNSSSDLDINTPYLEFTVNENERTITVTGMNNNINFNWDDISVCPGGYALLPTGAIDIDDKISNCYGTVRLELPDGSIIGQQWTFSEKPTEPFDDIIFAGQWEGKWQELNLYPNGTYLNNAWDFDSSDGDNEPPAIATALNNGKYGTETLFSFHDASQVTPYICDFSLSANLTVMNLFCYSDRSSVQLKRNFTDDLYIIILNASKKLDYCLLSFISNYSNETHKEALSEGLNVTVVFTNNTTQDTINNIIVNLTDKGLVFNTNITGSIIRNNTNYSMKIDSLQDLYNLVYRVDVTRIIANDTKFGCT